MTTTTEAAPPTHRRPRTGAGARLNADHIALYRAVNAGVIITALAAVAISWQGLMAVGEWLLLPPYLTWLLPVAIDVAIIVFTLATLARRGRGESVSLLLIGAYGLTAVSAAANFAHVMLESPAVTNPLQVYAGAGLASLAPLLILLTTEVLATLATKPPSEHSPRAKASRQAARIKELEKTVAAEAKARKAAEKKLAERAEPAEVMISGQELARLSKGNPTQLQGDTDPAVPGLTVAEWNGHQQKRRSAS